MTQMLPDLLMTPVAAVPAAARWAATLVQWTAAAGVVVLGLSILLCMFRLVRGPTIADRGAALDVIGLQLVGIIVLLTVMTGSLHYVDGILVVSLLAFAGTVAVAQFVARPSVREPAAGAPGPTPQAPPKDDPAAEEEP